MCVDQGQGRARQRSGADSALDLTGAKTENGQATGCTELRCQAGGLGSGSPRVSML